MNYPLIVIAVIIFCVVWTATAIVLGQYLGGRDD